MPDSKSNERNNYEDKEHLTYKIVSVDKYKAAKSGYGDFLTPNKFSGTVEKAIEITHWSTSDYVPVRKGASVKERVEKINKELKEEATTPGNLNEENSSNDLAQETRENGSRQSSITSDTSPDRTTDRAVSTESLAPNVVFVPEANKKEKQNVAIVNKHSKLPRLRNPQTPQLQRKTINTTLVRSNSANFFPKKPIVHDPIYIGNDVFIHKDSEIGRRLKEENPNLKLALTYRDRYRLPLTPELKEELDRGTAHNYKQIGPLKR